MPALIVFRLVQGLGAGAVQPISMTILGDLYTLEERAKVQGYVAWVWAVASVVGPTLGGVFSDYLSWRWIFFVNLPIGLAAAWVLLRRFEEEVERRRHSIDVAGAVLLGARRHRAAARPARGRGALGVGLAARRRGVRGRAVLLVGFVAGRAARRRAGAAAVDLPAPLAQRRQRASFVVGMVLLGLTSYVPLYAQSVLGHGAVVAGLALAAMTIGWPIAASTAGRLYLSLGFRATLTIGAVIAVLGGGAADTVSADSLDPPPRAAVLRDRHRLRLHRQPRRRRRPERGDLGVRGVATGSNMFARSVGSAVGVALFGALVNAMVTTRLAGGTVDLETLPVSTWPPPARGLRGCCRGHGAAARDRAGDA